MKLIYIVIYMHYANKMADSEMPRITNWAGIQVERLLGTEYLHQRFF